MSKKCPECHTRLDVHWSRCWVCGHGFEENEEEE